MEITMLDKQVLSSDGMHLLQGRLYVPVEKPKGLFHIVHGMTEYIGRYHDFMCRMAEAGYVCFGYDHLGHGRTAQPEERGFIAGREGDVRLCEDVGRFAQAVRAEYGEDLPYYLMGHSMGSFIARLAVANQIVKPDKLIVMGTGGPNPAAGPGLLLLRLIRGIYGEKHISPFMEKIMFGGYHKRFEQGDPKAWLTKEMAVREKYRNDPLCMFHFTVSALQDLVRLTKNANAPRWFQTVPKDLPVLLVSGKEDPVGDYGKGVVTVCKKLQAAGCSVTMKLYEDCRHEVLNDTCKEDVIRDICGFLTACAK